MDSFTDHVKIIYTCSTSNSIYCFASAEVWSLASTEVCPTASIEVCPTASTEVCPTASTEVAPIDPLEVCSAGTENIDFYIFHINLIYDILCNPCHSTNLSKIQTQFSGIQYIFLRV